MAYKCLDICQALVAKGQPFTFSLSVGSTLTFSLDTRGEEPASIPVARKKVSPSTMRRNAKRKEVFLQRKAESTLTTPEVTVDKPEAEGSWRNEGVTVSDKSVKLKLKKNTPEKVPQLDGQEEEVTFDSAVQTEKKPDTKHTAVQTIKTAPVLEIRKTEESNISGLPGMPIQVANLGPYRAPKANMGPYRAPTTNMGPYKPPHSRGS